MVNLKDVLIDSNHVALMFNGAPFPALSTWSIHLVDGKTCTKATFPTTLNPEAFGKLPIRKQTTSTNLEKVMATAFTAQYCTVVCTNKEPLHVGGLGSRLPSKLKPDLPAP